MANTPLQCDCYKVAPSSNVCDPDAEDFIPTAQRPFDPGHCLCIHHSDGARQ